MSSGTVFGSLEKVPLRLTEPLFLFRIKATGG
jgi:hypothetical protein